MNVLNIMLNSIRPYTLNILWIIFVVVATKIVLTSFNDIMRYIYRKHKVPKRNYLIIRNIIFFTIHFIAVVLILLAIPGVDQKVLTIMGIGLGLLVSFSSTSTVGNIVAGAIIHLTRPITEGDYVEIDGVFGDIVSIEMLFVHIKTSKNEIVSIPSLQVLNNRITNYSKMEQIAIPVTVSIGYREGSAKVKKLLNHAALQTEGIVKKPEPFILINNLGDYSVNYELNAFTDKHHGLIKIKSNLRESIMQEFAHTGVEILSPMYVTARSLSDGNKVIAKKEDSKSKQHRILEHHENIDELNKAKERLEEKKRTPTTIEEIKKEQHKKGS